MFNKKKIVAKLMLVVVIMQIFVVGVFAQQEYYSIDFNKNLNQLLQEAKPGEESKIRLAYNGKERMYYFVDAKVNEELQPIVDAYKPSGKTDIEKITSVTRYMESLGLVYSEKNKYNSYHQIENIKQGHTMCLGATILGAKLLDKTNLEYRYVLSWKKSRINPIEPSQTGGHIALEIKTDKGKWVLWEVTLIICNPKKVDLMPFIAYDIDHANEREEIDIPERTFYESIGTITETDYREFVVSPSYKNGEIVDNYLKIFNDLLIKQEHPTL